MSGKAVIFATMSRKTFLKEFWKERKMVGSIHPSSKWLSRRMCAPIDLQNAKTIVEFGPGDGCITKEIIRRMGPDTQLIVFEMHQAFVDKFLQFGDPRVRVICDSAEHLDRYLEEMGIEKVDAIISSLPLTNFPKTVKENILNVSVASLKKEGVYMQYQYMTTAMKLLKSKFSKVKLGFVPRNIPPAFVYTCRI